MWAMSLLYTVTRTHVSIHRQQAGKHEAKKLLCIASGKLAWDADKDAGCMTRGREGDKTAPAPVLS